MGRTKAVLQFIETGWTRNLPVALLRVMLSIPRVGIKDAKVDYPLLSISGFLSTLPNATGTITQRAPSFVGLCAP